MDPKSASRLVRKTLVASVQFSAEEIYELMNCCDTTTMNILFETAHCSFAQERLEGLYGGVDDEILNKVAQENHVTLFDYGEETVDGDFEIIEAAEKPRERVSLFGTSWPLG